MNSSASRVLSPSLRAVLMSRPWLREKSSYAGKSGRKVFVEKMTLIEKLIPPGIILGALVIYYNMRRNMTGISGMGWLGEYIWVPYGKNFAYRKPIADQIAEQKRQEYAEGKEWPWRIWVG